MTLQPLQFGAFTPHQQRMVDREMPSWVAGQTLVTGRYPGSEIFAYMQKQGAEALGDKSLTEDTFTPSEDFLAAEADLLDLYQQSAQETSSLLSDLHNNGGTQAFRQQGAERLLELIKGSDLLYVSDSLIRTLLQVANS